jgi:hypothetical protein
MRRSTPARAAALRLLIPIVCAALIIPASGLAVKRGAEVIDSGGGPAADGTVRLYDAIGQVCGPAMTNGSDMHGYDGFLLCLPSINVPVEGAFFASLTEETTATIRWSIPSLDGITGLSLHRATAEEGPYEPVSDGLLPPTPSGSFVDDSLWPQTTFWYELRALLEDGTEDVVGVSRATVTTGGELRFALRRPFPNPSRSGASFSFDLPHETGQVSLTIYSVEGRAVATVLNEPMPGGRHEVRWDGRDGYGAPVSSGVYFARLQTARNSASTKVVVLR